ncbi:DNA sulfur modification protein DndB [Clostridium perfringens]|nr:DNA sulfur modification protein DndB [Clostridium perfringens]
MFISMELDKRKEKILGELKLLAKSNFTDKTLSNKILTITKDRIPLGKTEDLLRTDIDLYNHFNMEELYWLIKAYFIVLKEKKLDPKNFFTETEIENGEQYYKPSPVYNGDERVFVLENVKRNKDGSFICWECPFTKIKQALDFGITTYDFRTQRQATVKQRGGEILLFPTIIEKNVREIQAEILDNNFEPNTLTWNILNNGEEEFVYDEESETLIFTKTPTSIMSIIDGYNRTVAINRALGTGEEILKDYMYIKILNVDIAKAQNYILQEQKGSKLSITQQKAFKNDGSVMVAKSINTNGNKYNNVLYSKISMYGKEVYTYNKKAVLLSCLSEMIENNYGDLLKTPKEIRRVGYWLVDFFNEALGNYSDEFNNLGKSRIQSVLTYNNMFEFYIRISRYFYDNRVDWIQKVEQIMDNIDFRIENPIWNKIGVDKKRWDKRIINSIDKYADEILESYINN